MVILVVFWGGSSCRISKANLETRRTLVNVGLPGVPGSLQRTLRGRAVTMGELRPELMEVDLTSRMSSSKETWKKKNQLATKK